MIKRRNYTFALTKDNERIIKIVEKYPKYAYIKHDKDDAEVHYHYYVEFPNPRSIKNVAQELKIPENMLEQVYNKRGILEYLTHKNELNKHHYDDSEIKTNMDFTEEIKAQAVSKEEIELIINAIADYDEGTISYRQLMNQMVPFINPRNAEAVFRLFISGARRNVWACHTFRVPSSTTPINGTKKGGKNDLKK